MPRWSSHRADGVTVRCRVRRVAALTATSAIVAGLLAAPAAYAATATSTNSAVANAQKQLDAISVQADQAVEAYDEAQTALSAVAATASAAKAAAAQEQTVVDAAKVGVQAFAVARYEGTSATPALAVLLSTDPSTFLERSQVLQQVSRYQSASLTDVINADRTLAVLQTSSEQAVAAQQAATAKLTAKKAAVDKVLGQQQSLLNVLQTKATQDQAAKVTAEAAAAQALRQDAVSRSLARPALRTSRTQGQAPVVPDLVSAVMSAVVPAASGRVSAALAWAYAQLGKPYHYGGAGPRSFDCSGLTMRAFAAAGISLPHSAAGQQHVGRRVPMSQLQPGDLVFWGSPAYHVGIYVGGGRIIDAPHTGTDVQIQALWGRPSSAVRL
jgi:cell wall-associated NlpC family hydrolase